MESLLLGAKISAAKRLQSTVEVYKQRCFTENEFIAGISGAAAWGYAQAQQGRSLYSTTNDLISMWLETAK